MGSHWFLELLVANATAVSIEADMERVLCLPHILQFAFPALDEVDDIPRLAGCCCSYVEPALESYIQTLESYIQALESYIQALNEGMKESLHQKRIKKDNLTREERGALKSLRNRVQTGEIVIKPADKGSATVVMSHDDYVAEAMRQLIREEHYFLLDRDPTTKYAEEITKLLA